MKKIIDITGIIDKGMWNYEPPFTEINIKPLPPIPWLDGKTVGCEIFEGLHSQSGTYLETPAHSYGNNNGSYALIEVPVDKIYEIPCVVLNVGLFEKDYENGRHGITVDELKACFNADQIQEGDAVIVGTGWGKYWFDPENLDYAPYFTYDALEWLISKKPFLIGGDSARWDNLEHPQGFWDDFYGSDILMGGPFVDLEKCTAARCKLTILPPKFPITSCAPSRAVIIEED